MNKTIWVLTDFRRGTAVQALALAEELGFPYKEYELQYNFYSYLPNAILKNKIIHIKNKSDLINSGSVPDIIISAGRRAAAVAAFFKIKHPALKAIQIMRPGLDHKYFDLVILPQHDINYEHKNIYRIIGSMHNVAKKTNKNPDNLYLNYPMLSEYIAVLIGGDSKTYRYNIDETKEFVAYLQKISISHNLKLFITFSRRTNDKIKSVIKDGLDDSHIIFDPNIKHTYNPYMEMITNSKFVISTCDSISMLSEASATGVPIYIYSPPSTKKLKKHRFFVQQLVDLGVAKIINYEDERLMAYSYTPLDEVKQLVCHIKNHII